MSNAFGTYLRAKRVDAGVTLSELATRLGISHVHLSKVERGLSNPLDQKYWSVIVGAIPGTDIDELKDRCRVSRPVDIDVVHASTEYQNLTLVLARKIEAGALSKEKITKITNILNED
jgi:hypothetical protein